jgi:hypothetical protein
MLRRLFRDLRLLCALMLAWLCVVLILMIELGVLSNPTFVAWGPRPTLIFLHVPIDTNYKYAVLMLLIMAHTFVSDFISDGLVPHVINQLQDVRCRSLPHRHGVYYAVTSIWSVYSSVSYLFLICLALGQLDLLLVRLASDLLANAVTTRLYLEHKTTTTTMTTEDGATTMMLLSTTTTTSNNDSDNNNDHFAMMERLVMHDAATDAEPI